MILRSPPGAPAAAPMYGTPAGAAAAGGTGLYLRQVAHVAAASRPRAILIEDVPEIRVEGATVYADTLAVLEVQVD